MYVCSHAGSFRAAITNMPELFTLQIKGKHCVPKALTWMQLEPLCVQHAALHNGSHCVRTQSAHAVCNMDVHCITFTHGAAVVIMLLSCDLMR